MGAPRWTPTLALEVWHSIRFEGMASGRFQTRMIMGSVEYIGNIAYASTACVIMLVSQLLADQIGASLEFHDGSVVAKPHKLQM
jgi:hypothetical protein